MRAFPSADRTTTESTPTAAEGALLERLRSTTFSDLASSTPTVRGVGSDIAAIAEADTGWCERLAPHIAIDAELTAKLSLLQTSIAPVVESRNVVIPSLTYALLVGGLSTASALLGTIPWLGIAWAAVLLLGAVALSVVGFAWRRYARLRDHVAALRAAVEASAATHREPRRIRLLHFRS